MKAYTKVESQTNEYLILHTHINWFMDGNHPINMEQYYIYNRKNFKRIILDELFWKGFDQKSLDIAEGY